MQTMWRILLFTGVLLTTACTSTPHKAPIEPNVSAQDLDAAWHYLRFRIARDGDEIDSYIDGLIAHQLLAGVIDEYESDITLWRFHRRWPNDTTGHQFSFIFFATTTVAEQIHSRMDTDPLVNRLRTEGHLRELRLDRADPQDAKHIGATSDKHWPEALQREWPHFIMGASRMWLGLIESEAAKHTHLTLHERYRIVETALDSLWFKEANRALFHHLSALFGYKPVRVIRRDIMTF